MILGLIAFSLFHAWLYTRLARSWPPGLWPPLPLVAVELAFWAVVALAEALAIVAVLERPKPSA